MSLYNLPKEMLIKIITTIQEDYKLENMSREKLDLLKIEIEREIFKRAILNVPELKKFKDLIVSIKSFVILEYMIEYQIKDFYISVFPYSENVYIFFNDNWAYFYFDNVTKKVIEFSSIKFDLTEIFEFSKQLSLYWNEVRKNI